VNAESSLNSQEDSDLLYRMRHSLAHVLAQAVLEIREGSTLGFGPPIADGFYYDFVLSSPITDEDFPEIERRMKKILKKGQRFYREELSVSEAYGRISEMGEPYKKEYAEELVQKNELDTLTFYRNGPFVDMCEGPHVDTTKDIPRDAFKLRSVAGAYWRGDSNNTMMTRIYAWAFPDKEALDSHIQAYELALQRDHKKLGKELELFSIDDEVGRGLILWMPNGTVIRDELEKLAKELEFKAGYQRVATPHIAKKELYETTGHLPYYADDMYPPMELHEHVSEENGEEIKEVYILKPMNCPHHHKIFDAVPRSYRDLPLRLAEYGHCYRFEASGAVGGLVRVRGMCMNDAHIYCTEDQLKEEIRNVIALYDTSYDILGLKNYYFRLSTWDEEDPKGKEKYVDNPSAWEKSTKVLAEVLDELGRDYEFAKGEGAFYGPKIDVQFPTVTGRYESVSTVQLDFAIPSRMDLAYTGSDGMDHTPYVIHRAPLSTHERMVGYLIEHFGGAFPTWLSPVQVQVLTVSAEFESYASMIVDRLRGHYVRAELGSTGDTVSKKVRDGTVKKIPNLLVVGQREATEQTVTLRRYGVKKQESMSLDEFEARLLKTIQTRSLDFC